MEPDLAEAQPVVSKDGKTYTFRIRKDARFSDGTPVTARNFVRAFERIFDPSMKSSQEAFFDIIVGATEMLDGKTKTLAGVSAVRPDPHGETDEACRGLSDASGGPDQPLRGSGEPAR